MNVIVCNSGPLIALVGIEHLTLLRDLFDEVLIASDVKSEVEAGSSREREIMLLETFPWLRVQPHQPADAILTSLLDKGEAATIALAIERSASLILMDEVKGRRVARDVYGLAVIGTGRILIEAKKASLIRLVRPWIERMRSNGYWMSDKIVAEIIRQAGE